MPCREPARNGARPPRPTKLAALVVVIAALFGVIGYQWLAWLSTSSSSARSPIDAGPLAHRPHDRLPRDHHGPPDETDGVVPDGVTVFDDGYPGVANLDTDLLGALRQAATDAAGDGVEFYLHSGWRSPKYQGQLLREAIAKYGSRQEAARWVATPKTSAHVMGDAVDIEGSGATEWLSEHGTGYGLCQIYDNEPWHFELRPMAMDDGCPPMYADPTDDPRMQQ